MIPPTDAVAVALVSATTALVSAIVGPFVSFFIARRQIRATVISNNRERWIESLRDSVAEYVGLLLTAAMVKQAITEPTWDALRDDHDLRQIVERIVIVKNRILLITNPNDAQYAKLCGLIQQTYEALAAERTPTVDDLRSRAEAITVAGREVLRLDWARVKRGE